MTGRLHLIRPNAGRPGAAAEENREGKSSLSVVPHRMVRWRGAVTLIAVILLAFGLGQTSLGHTILGKAGLFKEPTSYTSLAFLHPQPLPPQLRSRKATVDVSFAIHNGGGTAHDYRWSVMLVQAQHSHPVAAGVARVPPGGRVAITRSARISCARGNVKIVVNLARPAEFIDAWTACPSPGGNS
jgi:hypothetical protein